jgi:Nucleotidyltransferase domain
MELAERIAERLADVEGVEAVVLGGSWARGEAHPDSDVDIGIYYRSERRPSLAALRELARELDDRHLPGLVTDFGGWGPWINGGGWLRIEDRRVDWLYRDLDVVSREVSECRAGRSTCHYQPGHPHGFHTHIYAGEVHYCRVLRDAGGELTSLMALVAGYPPALKRSLTRRFLWEAGFSLETCRKPAERGDVFYVGGCLFRCAACLVQVLFAINERYFVNEKGSVKVAGSFPISPEGFEETVSRVLAEPGVEPARLRESVRRFEGLVRTTREMSGESSPPVASL